MKSTAYRVACASLMSFACCSAGAVATASVRTSPLVVTLVDLDELDGIAPSISFAPAGPFDRSYAFARVRDQIQKDDVGEYGYFDAWGSAVMQGSRPGGTAFVEMVSAGTPAGSTFAASGSARGAGEGGQFLFDAYVKAPDTTSAFMLSANTLVQISLSSNISTASTFALYSTEGTEMAEAFVYLLFTGPGPTGVDFQRSYDTHRLRAGYGSGVSSAAGSETIRVSFSNQTSTVLQGEFSALAWAWGYSMVTLVPEPATSGLLLGGLGLLGVLRRVRRPGQPSVAISART